MSDDMADQAREGFGRAAAGWERWADLISKRDDAGRYIDAAEIEPGQRVVEIGAGTGEQTLALARRVGPDGQVLATDLSEEMLSVARKRVRAAGLDNVTFEIVDASRIELDVDAFDAAVSGLTWMFLPDPVGSAAQVRSLLAPGARFAASVWGPTPDVPMVSVAMSAVSQKLDLGPPAPDERGIPELSDGEVFHDVLVDAGFQNVSVSTFSFILSWESPEQYAEWVRDVMIDLFDLVTEHARDRVEDIYASIADAARPHTGAEDTLTFDNLALLGTGRRPA